MISRSAPRPRRAALRIALLIFVWAVSSIPGRAFSLSIAAADLWVLYVAGDYLVRVLLR